MGYIDFVRSNGRLLSFGMLMTYLSGYGQTYLLAIYIPFLMEEFGLANAEISAYYMLATIASALLLPHVGKLIDQVKITTYTMCSTVVFVVSMIGLSMVRQVFLLPFVFFGLRIAGQGLFSHISMTSMSKYFHKGRGKAISLASLGHPLGQALLPITVVWMLGFTDWRGSLLVSAALVLITIPLLVYFLLDERNLVIADPDDSTTHVTRKEVSTWQIMGSKAFWLLAPNLFALAFIITGLFFYQFSIADFKGWTIQWMALGLTCYAISGSVAILFAGPLIDRYTAKQFFPFYLFPFLVAVFFIWLMDNPWVIFPYMILMGVSAGMGNAIISALQVELFGAAQIGKVRSVFTSVMVFSSAVGPAVYGVIIDLGYRFDVIFVISIVLMLLVTVQSFRIIPAFTYAKMKYRFKNRHRRFDFFNVFNLKH
ncbi:major facilitator superfamily permease [Lunatimonas lonarensis]|uniref:Major facilitator superfamily permease n=1 Tax=Lunatimonas lonarensis TaxID=1232681 RepID=R7ZRE4_9BACT|nr:MFS transporter [Lunatimonas lonarensis]EON76574.1 major facilitator superfamily permease [Lunatimonas lonarensis]